MCDLCHLAFVAVAGRRFTYTVCTYLVTSHGVRKKKKKKLLFFFFFTAFALISPRSRQLSSDAREKNASSAFFRLQLALAIYITP